MSDRAEVEQPFLLPTKLTGIVSLAIAFLVLPLGPICVRWSLQEIDPIATIFYRFFFAGMVCTASNFWTVRQDGETHGNSRKIIGLLLGVGVCDVANQLFWVWSIERTYIGNCSFINSLTPILVALLAWLFLRRSFEPRFLMGMAIAVGGAMAIAIGDIQFVGTKLQGDIFALISATCRAAYFLIAERLRVYFNAGYILFWSCLSGSVLLFPLLGLGGDRLIPQSSSGWGAIACLVVIFLIGRGMLVNSLKSLSSNVVTVVFLLEHFLVAIQGWLILSETLRLSEWLSFAIVAVGVYLALSSRDRAVTE
ncbi:MAG: DMT family transporter [Cyanobacteria bacterium SBLK]|nr:DMT family transporter [Cyanobacteria bacterium SBLK]